MQKHNLRLVSDAEAIATETKKIKLKKGLILKKRRDGRSDFWYAQITITGNRQPKLISTECTDSGEATQKAFELEAQLKADAKSGFAVFDKSFEAVAEDFLLHQKQRLFDGEYSQSSFETDTKCVQKYLVPYFKSKKIKMSKITKVVLNQFKTWLTQNSLSGGKLGTATRRKYENILGSVLKFAESKGYIKELPNFERTKASNKETPSFTKEQFRKMMRKLKEYIELAPNKRDAHSRQMMYYALSILVKTGLRPHELLCMPHKVANKTVQSKGLKWRNVEFFKDDVTGKHSVDLYIEPDIDKNRKGRTVPADKTVYFILSKLYSMTTETQKKIGNVFDTDYRSAFPRFLEWANMRTAKNGNNFTFYSLRHTYITWHTEDKPTSNPSQLAKVAGNSVTTIERYYDKSSTKNFRHNFI